MYPLCVLEFLNGCTCSTYNFKFLLYFKIPLRPELTFKETNTHYVEQGGAIP